jgi:large subunit ribosomal protein L24
MRIKKDDMVKVITGDDLGKVARVLRVVRETNKIVVEHVNRVYKHVRRSQKNPQGGRLNKEMPIHVSNVLLVCSACGKPTRVGARVLSDGGKERFCKKCGVGLGTVRPARQKKSKAT